MATLPVVRFAPSPTGRIHIGNARTALLNWLFVRRHGGTFILRFDDTDLERSRTEYADAIEADLEWLGIRPDLVRRQSERMAAYDTAAARLRDLGRLYPAEAALVPDAQWSRADCEVLAALDAKHCADRWLELQAGFYNATGRMVPLEVLRAKFGD